MRIQSTLLLLTLAVPAVAQEQEIRNANLPRQLEWELLRMYEGGAKRYTGEARIGPSEVVSTDVAASGGTLYVAGRVMGDLAMVGGDVVMESGGEVTGNVTVIGGEIRMADDATVNGTITAYATSTTVRRTTRERESEDRRDDDWRRSRRDRWDYDRGYSRLTLRTGASYNRVEGLPVMFGPVIQTGGANPLRLEALAIWRSEAGASLDTDRMGYQAKIEQFLGGNRDISLGGTVYSVVDPMDRWQITDLEASLATAVFHEDFRDHYDRTGWSAFLRVQPIHWLEARVDYKQERHASVAAGDPWSLFDDDRLWRAQPLVAEGDMRAVTGSIEIDRRDREDDPSAGWYARLAFERPVGGELVRPALTGVTVSGEPRFGAGPLGATVPAATLSTDFTSGLVDLRAHYPVGYRSQLGFRLVGGGNLAEEPLPPQYQHALGGLGTLPGFETFHADCGVRSAVGTHDEQTYHPAYGCDRFALAQVEYRGRLSLDFGFGEPDYDDGDWWDEFDIDLSPTWVVLFDAGRGWGYPDPTFDSSRDTGVLYDVGVGFLIDQVGIYAALPLNGDVPQEPRFFVRLGRRF